MNEATSRQPHGIDDQDLDARISRLKEQLQGLAAENRALHDAGLNASEIIDALEQRRNELRAVNQRLAQVSAESAELLADLEAKNEALKCANQQLAVANVHAAELMAEIELKNEQIEKLNEALARGNAHASELVAELEFRKEELERLNSALGEANDEKSRLLGIAAHDLRAGIGGIGGLADLLLESLPPGDDDPAEHGRMIRSESQRLLDLLSSLLDVSRVEQGKLELAPERISLGELLSQVADFHRRFAAAKNQTVTLGHPDQAIDLTADPRRLRQVLDNLLSNAIKYSPPGSGITVEVRSGEGEVTVAVLDRGPGLTQDDLSKVFRTFQPLSAQPTGGEESHGLGLAMAKKVVELHDGRIWAENRTDGAGACFAFALPVRLAEPAAKTEAPSVRGPRRILLADDRPVNQTLAQRLLAKGGHTVEVVSNGAEAAAAARDAAYDLIFMDVEMPVMNGYEAAKAIRAEEDSARRTPILAMTAHLDDAHVRRAIEAGMDGHLAKPFNRQRLEDAIEQYARRAPT